MARPLLTQGVGGSMVVSWKRSGWMAVAAGMLAVASLLGSGCGRATVGETGVVAFELAVAHVEAIGVGAPVARGSTLLLHVSSETVRTGAISLEAQGLEGNEVHVFPTGFGQFGVHVPDAGAVRLVARVDGEEVDALQLSVVEPDALSLSESAVLETREGECVTRQAVKLSEVVLAPNQRLRTFVVPRAGGRALVGLLTLDASAEGAEVAPLEQGDEVPAHAIEVALREGSGITTYAAPIELRVRDTVNALDVRRRISTSGTTAADAACRATP